jgi:polysaccharide export outer membrane protein
MLYQNYKESIVVVKMKRTCFKAIFTAILIFLLMGCVLAPGWKMSDPPSLPGVKIIPIDKDLISSKRVDKQNLALQQNKRYKYLIGPRDILNITVWDHPELTIPQGQFRDPEVAGTLVGEDGTIFYPYVGIINVAGKTIGEARKILTQRLSGKIVNPQLDVKVAAYRSQKAFIVGQVNDEGPLPITDVPLTVVDAINQTGGVMPAGDKVNVTLKRKDKIYHIDLLGLFQSRDQSKNYVLQDGDILHVPDLQLQKVFVMGEVGRPDALQMNNGKMTLTEALGDVGGVNQVTSNPELIYVIRGNPDETIVYHLDSKSPDALILANQFEIQPRDVVFVGTAGVTRWSRVISQILPTASFITGTATDVARTNN